MAVYSHSFNKFNKLLGRVRAGYKGGGGGGCQAFSTSYNEGVLEKRGNQDYSGDGEREIG